VSVDIRKRITVIRDYEIAVDSNCMQCCGKSCSGLLALPTALDTSVREDVVPAYCDIFNVALKWHPSHDSILRTPACLQGEGQ
jgi:hypothetical protein